MLCAVAVHHSPNGQHKTIFRSPEEGFKTSEFVAKFIRLVKKEDREGVLRELGNLAALLQAKQSQLLQAKQSQLEEAPRKAKRGDAVLFASDSFHAGAPATTEDLPRVTSYFQFAPTVVVQNEEWWPLLRTLYDSEHVFDRRSMVGRNQLLLLMNLHVEDPLVVEHAGNWLDGLYKGRVNCIQS